MKHSHFLINKSALLSSFLILSLLSVTMPLRVSAQVTSDILGAGGGVDGSHASNGPSLTQQGNGFSSSLSEKKFSTLPLGKDLISGSGYDEFSGYYESGCTPTISSAWNNKSIAYVSTVWSYTSDGEGGVGTAPCVPGSKADLTRATLVAAPPPSGFGLWWVPAAYNGRIQSYDSNVISLGEQETSALVKSNESDSSKVIVTYTVGSKAENYIERFHRYGFMSGNTFTPVSDWLGIISSYDEFAGQQNQRVAPSPEIIQIPEHASPVSTSVVRERNSDIVFLTQPQCSSDSDSGFWRSKQWVDCVTYGLSADGRIGTANYHNEQSSRGWYMDLVGVATLAVTIYFGFGDFNLFGGFTADVLGGYSATVSSITTGASIAGQVATLSATNFVALQQISSPSASLAKVETSDNLGVGTWTWSRLVTPSLTPTTPLTPTTCTSPQRLVNGVCVTPPLGTPTASLSLSPTSCVIASGASTCSTVYATWTTSHATAPALVDGNVGATLSTRANQSSPGLQVWVAYPQTVFNLKDGSTILDTKTATASCAPASTWNGSVCAPSPCVATTDNNCSLPATASGSSAGSCSSGYSGSCNYVCNSGTWSKSSNSCVLPLAVSCSGTPGNPYINQPVTWSSSVTGGSGSYLYVWSSTSDPYLFETIPSFKKSYTTPGQKNASLSITDSTSDQTASATCTNGDTGGTSINVKSCTASLTASPNIVEQGQNTTLSWTVSDGPLCASSCSGSGFNTGGATSGTASPSVLPTPPTTSYTLTCTAGAYGPPPPANATVTVHVPTVTVTANEQSTPARVDPKIANNTTITWSSDSSVVSCTGTNFSTGGDPSGSVTLTTTAQTTYTIDCVNHYGAHVINSIIVNILLNYNEF